MRIELKTNSFRNKYVEFEGYSICPDCVAYCMNKLTDKEAEEVGFFLWGKHPSNNTKDMPPAFLEYRKKVYAELDERGITHPALDDSPVMKEVVKEINACQEGVIVSDRKKVTAIIPVDAYDPILTYKIKEPVK